MSRWGSRRFRTAWATGLFGLMLLAFTGAVKANGQTGSGRPAAPPSPVDDTAEAALRQAEILFERAAAWYGATPPADRVTWAALIACAGLGGSVLVERLARLRRGRVVPRRFVERWLERMEEGLTDRGKALDLCELNPSPASRIALAALRRWGRPTADLERAVALARQVEVERLGRNLGTLRRVAAMAPLVGLLGSLFAAGRAFESLGQPGAVGPWGPALAEALAPLTAGVGLAILSLLAFDGLTARVEKMVVELDRLGAETIDAIALAAPAIAPMPRGVPSANARPSAGIPLGPRTGSSPSAAEAPRAPHFRPMGVPISRRPLHPIRDEVPEDLQEF